MVEHTDTVPEAKPLTVVGAVNVASVVLKPQNVMNSLDVRFPAVIVTRVLVPAVVVNEIVPQGALLPGWSPEKMKSKSYIIVASALMGSHATQPATSAIIKSFLRLPLDLISVLQGFIKQSTSLPAAHALAVPRGSRILSLVFQPLT
jgi:hypothetical protein